MMFLVLSDLVRATEFTALMRTYECCLGWIQEPGGNLTAPITCSVRQAGNKAWSSSLTHTLPGNRYYHSYVTCEVLGAMMVFREGW